MFENLVECNNQKKSNKKLVYFAVTSVLWTLGLASSAAAGVLLYEAKLDEQFSLITMLAPPPPPPPAPASSHKITKTINQPVAKVMPTTMATPKVPDKIAQPAELAKVAFSKSDNLDFDNNSDDSDGPDGGVKGGKRGGVIGNPLVSDLQTSPPPPPPQPEKKAEEVQKPSILRTSEGVIRGNATNRVSPDYPGLARTAHIQGEVPIEITIGENGNVVSARVLGGHSLLQQSALNAAKQWRFNPTLLNGTPVKVQGILTFRFIL